MARAPVDARHIDRHDVVVGQVLPRLRVIKGLRGNRETTHIVDRHTLDRQQGRNWRAALALMVGKVSEDVVHVGKRGNDIDHDFRIAKRGNECLAKVSVDHLDATGTPHEPVLVA
jgi:hypothetical protein